MSKLEKPYIRKVETLDDITVWEVDGHYIRDNINREFTNFGQHYRFPFIPTHEFWLDKEHAPNEKQFYIEHLLVEWHYMREGMSYDKALGKADEEEQEERSKVDFMERMDKGVSSLFDLVPREVYVKDLVTLGNIEVKLISGKVVRDLYYIDFTEGGHHFIYEWVPLKEVWIDDDLSATEREFVLLHELHERYLMAKGDSYTKAHASSSLIEYKCRRDPSLLKKCLQEEIEKNATLKSK
jgi:hypothetical protein